MNPSVDALDPGTPRAEVDVNAGLVRQLLEEQHPDLASLPLTAMDAGWDNAMFRLGEDLAVRVPRRRVAADLIEHEQRWLGALAGRLPVAVPAPVRQGAPGAGYPWRWSVLPWLPGEPADLAPPGDGAADILAGFLRALHVTAPADAPANEFRGVSLHKRTEVVQARMERLSAATSHISRAVGAAWESALAAADDTRRCWLHGDLHARNVLVAGGVISAVIDWGDICAGDRATDLASVWMLLDTVEARHRAIEAYGPVDPGTWRRALGWAVSFGTVLLESGLADHPRHARMGRDTLRRISEGPHPGELV